MTDRNDYNPEYSTKVKDSREDRCIKSSKIGYHLTQQITFDTVDYSQWDEEWLEVYHQLVDST